MLWVLKTVTAQKNRSFEQQKQLQFYAYILLI